jgi:predicted enzyme related to lactoylglutathione lyase
MKPGRIDNLILDSTDPRTIAPFWCALLGVEVIDEIGEAHYLELGTPPAGGLPIIIQQVPETKVAKNRMHVDIEVEDLEEATLEIERLGGRWRDGEEHDDHGYRWRVMADPEGNEFCIFPARS